MSINAENEGFRIICNKCGAACDVKAGDKSKGEPVITFGTDRMEDDYIRCRNCGHGLISHYEWKIENEEDEGILIDEWRCVNTSINTR